MFTELEILLLVCSKLEQSNIPYMLTGSFAANFFAVPRMTRDIDIIIEINSLETKKILQAFQNDFYVSENSISEAIKHQGMFNIIHNDSVFKIDFIIRKDETYRAIEFQRRRQIQLGNDSIWIVSPEDLIISKLDWTKDHLSITQLNDIKNLLSLKNLDRDYIQEWVQKLELTSVYNRINTYE